LGSGLSKQKKRGKRYKQNKKRQNNRYGGVRNFSTSNMPRGNRRVGGKKREKEERNIILEKLRNVRRVARHI